MKDRYIVSVTHVPGVSRLRMKDYIEEAVSIWAGSFRPSKSIEGFYNENIHDPLGPPCPLMEKGAVSVKMISRKHERF